MAPGAAQPRDLLRVAFGPSALAIVVIAAITLVQLVVANSDLTGAFGAVASLWLAAHGVPISIGGQQLGALPLLPMALIVWATAKTTAQVTPARGSWFVIRWIIAAAVGGPLFLTAVTLAVVHDAASVLTDLQTPNALRAFVSVAVVAGLGAIVGVWPVIGPRVMAVLGLPRWVLDAVRPALYGIAALLALSCAVVAGSLIVHWGTMHDLYGITDSLFGYLSLTLLSLLYLPNVVLGAAAVAVGSSAHIGFATFSAFTVFGGDIPALPILAAAPTPPLGPVWVAWLIIGAASGVAIGQQCALLPLPLPLAMAKLAVASALAAVTLAILAFAASGPLGNFGHVGVDQATFGPGVFFWFFVVGGLTVAMAGGVSRGPVMPRAGVEGAPVARNPAKSRSERTLGEAPGAESESAFESAFEPEPGPGPRPESATGPGPEPSPGPEPESESESGPGSDPEPRTAPEAGVEAHAEAHREPVPPPPPVTPAPDVEDLEDLMFVDADLEMGGPRDGGQPPSGPPRR